MFFGAFFICFTILQVSRKQYENEYYNYNKPYTQHCRKFIKNYESFQ